jgi:hypothetical protein
MTSDHGRVKRYIALTTSVLLGLGCLTTGSAWSQTTAVTERSARESPPGTTSGPARAYHIGAQALGSALQEFASQAGLQLMFSEGDVAGMQTPGLQGSFSPGQALQHLLAGTGLVFEFPKPDAVIVRRPGNGPDSGHPGDSSPGGTRGNDPAGQNSNAYGSTTSPTSGNALAAFSNSNESDR